MGKTVRAVATVVATCMALLTVLLVGPAQAAEYTTIRSVDFDAYGKCLGISNFGQGIEVEMAKCGGYSQEYWFFDPLFSDRYRLRSGDPDAWNKCIDASRGKGAQLFVYRCDGTADQAFIKRFVDRGLYSLESARYPGLCLDVRDWGRSKVVQLWNCHGGDNQVWRSVH